MTQLVAVAPWAVQDKLGDPTTDAVYEITGVELGTEATQDTVAVALPGVMLRLLGAAGGVPGTTAADVADVAAADDPTRSWAITEKV
jgi:hypothetical protein